VFSVLVVLMIICHGEVLFWSSLFGVLKSFYLSGENFLEIWEIFCYYCIEYIMYPFGLHLFSFFSASVLRFGLLRVTELVYIPFTACELFD
jgi:hypothetical protein